jgi:hypothetical protein
VWRRCCLQDISSGNEYAWVGSPGNEVLGDKIRHQGHNSNEMLSRFFKLSQGYIKPEPTVMAKDSHMTIMRIIATIAPRAVLIQTANDDYANNAEGDAIGLELQNRFINFWMQKICSV